MERRSMGRECVLERKGGVGGREGGTRVIYVYFTRSLQ